MPRSPRNASPGRTSALAQVDALTETLSRACRQCKAEGDTGLVELHEALQMSRDLRKTVADADHHRVDWHEYIQMMATVVEAVAKLYSLLSCIQNARVSNAFWAYHGAAEDVDRNAAGRLGGLLRCIEVVRIAG